MRSLPSTQELLPLVSYLLIWLRLVKGCHFSDIDIFAIQHALQLEQLFIIELGITVNLRLADEFLVRPQMFFIARHYCEIAVVIALDITVVDHELEARSAEYV